MLRRIFVMLLVGSMGLTACGGGDDEGGGGGDDGGGDDGAIADVFDSAGCLEATQAMAAAASAVPQSFSGDSAGLEDSVAQLQAFAEAAPDEIREDLVTIYEGYASVAQAFADSGFDPTSGEAPPPEVISALQAAAAELDAQDFRDAIDRVNAWFESECGA
ncbi:MAG: hypothetical protein ACXWX6_10150 [Actinomycetota bacterium]